MSLLVACAACSRHVKRSESACPHCGARLQREATLLKTATAMLMGLGLTSCVEALYGVPTTSESGSDSEGTTTAGTTEATEATDSASSTTDATTGMSATGTSSTSSTTSTTSTSSTTSTTTDGTTGTTAESTTEMTTFEPDYGVPDTSGLQRR